MDMNDWHLERAKMVLDEWYTRANQYLMLSMEYRKSWLPSAEKLCRQKALKCKALGLVFHDRYKLLLEYK
jgi:hypothetical protein